MSQKDLISTSIDRYNVYQQSGDKGALREAIDLARQAILLLSPEDTDRPLYLTNLGIYLSTWYALTGERAALQKAIELTREAVALTPAGTTNRPLCLCNLGTRLSTWYNLTGERAALPESSPDGAGRHRCA